MAHPEKFIFWYDDDDMLGPEVGNHKTSRREGKQSRVMAIAAKGWSSPIVLAFFAVAIFFVVLISVRPNPGGSADARNAWRIATRASEATNSARRLRGRTTCVLLQSNVYARESSDLNEWTP